MQWYAEDKRHPVLALLLAHDVQVNIQRRGPWVVDAVVAVVAVVRQCSQAIEKVVVRRAAE